MGPWGLPSVTSSRRARIKYRNSFSSANARRLWSAGWVAYAVCRMNRITYSVLALLLLWWLMTTIVDYRNQTELWRPVNAR
jgi:hypothetical protein